jgi:uncharacterized membrane protein YdjX (TVP38/TMEM64 family)
MKKLLLLFFGLTALILVTFALFGESFDLFFSSDAHREFLQTHRMWAGPLGAVFLMSDLFLPIPTTVVIGALGAVLGVAPGFFWGWLGLCLAGFLGYGLARLGGKRWADRLSSPAEQEAYRKAFDTWGGLAVVVTRMLPILPEVFSVLAGLYGMRPGRFALAVTLGSIPPALAYAWIGAQARAHPGAAVWGLVALTALVWILFLALARRKSFRK